MEDNNMNNNLNYNMEIRDDNEDQQWVWRNGLCCNVKSRINILQKKLNSLNRKIEISTGANHYLKDVIDLNTELTGYFSAVSDNINIRDLFDFLTICFYEYEHFFKENKNAIIEDESVRQHLLPIARDIVYNHVRSILDFISNNTIDSFQFRHNSSSL
ncbi:uncharacterized protein LOC111713083 [Eurytemora carolleeae]|uniref:uncharacterized protein LOC111713083 n=1 Tax=Eurytemora carolleeae TaxID=1294199 RepID=UPI000C781AC3|nr:uncharacterized protein LOC111713083 [Eurytemora carolleeae]XP_023343644.1 uncharacterized protein LOC111713083 [Eurytemora carolleeae]|eukprot:XP_023343643.1 uncharacterized protein LOC111713083 [Eurytemora affinis]